ncbi:MAG: hypothetical protein EAS48_07480 [Chryseobacterium sp.]|nr:MAG: hypothetical protein EAS48_07480 [Chryseobacterium sp.]
MRKLGFFLFLLFHTAAFAQQTGSLRLKKYRVADLPERVNETSALTLVNGNLFTVNDSGNPAELFTLDKQNGDITAIQELPFPNIDWEALATDGESVFIGDIGNNAGARQNLSIRKYNLSNASDTLTVKFYYPEQEDFELRNLKTDFDAEALVFHGGKLHVFTKEWKSGNTAHYIIDPNKTEKQAAQKVETFPIGYMVTDAAYRDGKLYLVGYTKLSAVYLSVFEETERGLFFAGRHRRYRLGSAFSVAQIEGVTAADDGLYISGERFRHFGFDVPARLYFVPYTALGGF